MPIETRIRLYEDNGFNLSFMYEEYEIEQFGGNIPLVGDIIVSPGVRGDLNRQDPLNRTMYIVLDRYFQPINADEGAFYVCLSVKRRAGIGKEADVIGG